MPSSRNSHSLQIPSLLAYSASDAFSPAESFFICLIIVLNVSSRPHSRKKHLRQNLFSIFTTVHNVFFIIPLFSEEINSFDEKRKCLNY